MTHSCTVDDDNYCDECGMTWPWPCDVCGEDVCDAPDATCVACLDENGEWGLAAAPVDTVEPQ